eukprot:scaffold1504_cov417-Prasinococcus_capsulatus_cf.AAC.36
MFCSAYLSTISCKWTTRAAPRYPSYADRDTQLGPQLRGGLNVSEQRPPPASAPAPLGLSASIAQPLGSLSAGSALSRRAPWSCPLACKSVRRAVDRWGCVRYIDMADGAPLGCGAGPARPPVPVPQPASATLRPPARPAGARLRLRGQASSDSETVAGAPGAFPAILVADKGLRRPGRGGISSRGRGGAADVEAQEQRPPARADPAIGAVTIWAQRPAADLLSLATSAHACLPGPGSEAARGSGPTPAPAVPNREHVAHRRSSGGGLAALGGGGGRCRWRVGLGGGDGWALRGRPVPRVGRAVATAMCVARRGKKGGLCEAAATGGPRRTLALPPRAHGRRLRWHLRRPRAVPRPPWRLAFFLHPGRLPPRPCRGWRRVGPLAR